MARFEEEYAARRVEDAIDLGMVLTSPAERDAIVDALVAAREVARHSKRPTAERDLREALARLDDSILSNTEGLDAGVSE